MGQFLGAFIVLSGLLSTPCMAQGTWDTVLITIQTGNDNADGQSEVVGTLTTFLSTTTICLKPSSSIKPDSACPANKSPDPLNESWEWKNGKIHSISATLAVSQPQNPGIVPRDNLTIALRSGPNGVNGSDNWDIQALTGSGYYSTGMISDVTVIRASQPWTNSNNCIARLKALPNSTTVRFSFGSVPNSDATSSTSGGVFVDGVEAGQSSFCTPQNS